MHMSKKTYRKFNFWESPEESNVIERVDPSFFKEINAKVNNEMLATKKDIVKDNISLSTNEKATEKKNPIFHESLILQKKTEEIALSSKEMTTHSIVEDVELNQKDLVQDVFDANGGQWKVLLYFAEKCLETGTLSTGYIKLPHLAKKININEKTVHTAIYRLEKQKRLIIRQKGKEGAGGKSRFMLISDKIKNYILSHRDAGLNEPKHPKTDYDLIEFTTEQDEWKKIDVSPLSEIGFNEKHLLQLKKYNTSQIVQESINQFSFGLNHNIQIKKYVNPLLVFMGVLRKGEAWIEKNYMSPSEIAFNQLTEQKKNRINQIKKTEEECLLAEYVLWETSLTEQDKDKIIPEDIKKTKLSSAKAAVLRLYFKENIWPNKMPTELIALKKELSDDYKKPIHINK